MLQTPLKRLRRCWAGFIVHLFHIGFLATLRFVHSKVFVRDSTQVWPAACKYGAMAINLTSASPQDKTLTRWDFAVAHLSCDDVPPIKCVLRQLVFFRSKIGGKFAPDAAPGLLAGWRLEPGCSYQGVGFVLDLAKIKNRTGAWTDPFPVPEQEIYVRDEVPGFPLKDAEIALSRLGFMMRWSCLTRFLFPF